MSHIRDKTVNINKPSEPNEPVSASGANDETSKWRVAVCVKLISV